MWSQLLIDMVSAGYLAVYYCLLYYLIYKHSYASYCFFLKLGILV
jgi:hypothetical protein